MSKMAGESQTSKRKRDDRMLKRCENCGVKIPLQYAIMYPIMGFYRFFCSWKCTAEFIRCMMEKLGGKAIK